MSMAGRALITGGAGFIGSSVASRLLNEGMEVVIFDNLHRDAVSKTSLLGREGVRFIRGDVRDLDALTKAAEGCTHVIHMASIAGVDTVMKMPVETMQISLIGTQNILEVARKMGNVDRLIDMSTSEVFGRFAYRVSEGDVTQLGAVGEARWTYAVSKLATEHLAHCYYKQFDLPTVAIRPFNIYGPNQVGEGAVHHFILRAIAGEDLLIHNDGSQIRSWCYIDDIVDGIVLCLTRPEAIGQSFNIGNPRSTVTIHWLAKEIARLAGDRSQLRFVEWNFPDVELRIPNIEKASRMLGYSPKVDLEEGLLRTLEWYRAGRTK